MVGPYVNNSINVECHTAAFVPVVIGLLNQGGEKAEDEYIYVLCCYSTRYIVD